MQKDTFLRTAIKNWEDYIRQYYPETYRRLMQVKTTHTVNTMSAAGDALPTAETHVCGTLLPFASRGSTYSFTVRSLARLARVMEDKPVK